MSPKQTIRKELIEATLEQFFQLPKERYSPGIFVEWAQDSSKDLTALEMCEATSTLETFDDCLPSTELIWLVSQLLASRESQNILADSAYRWLPSVISQVNPAATVFSPRDRLGLGAVRKHWTDGAFELTYTLYSEGDSQRFDAIAIFPYRDNRDWDTEHPRNDIQCDDRFYTEGEDVRRFYDKLTDDAVLLWLDNAGLSCCEEYPFREESKLAAFGFHPQAVFECPVSSLTPAHRIGWLYVIEKKPRPLRLPLYKIDSTNSIESKLEQVGNVLSQYRSGKILRTFADQTCPGVQLVDLRKQLRNLAKEMNVPVVVCKEFLSDFEWCGDQNGRWRRWKVDAEKVDSRYLSMLFQTPIGDAWSNSLDSLYHYFWNEFLLETAIPLPSLQRQVELVKTQQLIHDARQEINLAEKLLWQDRASVFHVQKQLSFVVQEAWTDRWVLTMPYPLSSILIHYQKSGNDEQTRVIDLLCFFETLCQYLATVLLSIVRDNDAAWKELNAKLSYKNAVHFDRPTSFGTWLYTFKAISKFIRDMINRPPISENNAILFEANSTVLRKLTDAKLVEVFENANNFRNNWKGHGARVVSGPIAKERRDQLDSLLREFHEILGYSLSDFELVIPLDGKRTRNGYLFNLKKIMGYSAPFSTERNHPIATAPIDGLLHLRLKECDHLVPLIPFIVFRAGVLPSCYVYSRVIGESYLFNCHHNGEEPEIRMSRGADIELDDFIENIGLANEFQDDK